VNHSKYLHINKDELIEFIERYFFTLLDSNRFSFLFFTQLFVHYKAKRWDIHKILDEIKYLEGLRTTTPTKGEGVFMKKPLIGLSYKHFTTARFISKNIENYLSKSKVREILKETSIELNTNIMTEEFASIISHKMTVDAYMSRAKERELTGEWIIYSKYNGKNYYLTLAEHNEGDEKVFNRIKDYCFSEFPFLIEQLQVELPALKSSLSGQKFKKA